MKPNLRKPTLPLIFFTFFLSSGLLDATGLVGTSSFQVTGGNSTNPTYYIASAPISEDSVFTGTVSSTDDSNAYLLFDTETNASGAVFYPFFGNSVFLPGMQIPEINATISGGQVTSVTRKYYNETFNSNKDKFTDPPEIVLYDADSNATAEITAQIDTGLNQGQIAAFTNAQIISPGTGYENAPKVKVIAGPHFVKISDNNNPYNGRVFLIKDNNKTRLNIDLSRKANSESSATVSTFFPVGTRIEIIPAATLGSLFGNLLHELPTNWSFGLPNSADWVYIWDVLYGGYRPYFFLGTTHESYGYGQGWYSKDSTSAGILNNTVIYPDEAFIIAKKTPGDVTFEFEGQIETTDKKLLLPESGNQILAKNPYGADLMITELIPTSAITPSDGNASLFRAMNTSNDVGDILTILDGNQWKQYYYDESYGNTAVSKPHVIGVRRPLDASDNNLSGTYPMDANDFLIDEGNSNTISNIQSCDINGNTDQNDTSYSKVFLNDASTNFMKGFTITFEGIQGYLLADDGLNEVNATTNVQVTSVSDFSQLSGLSARGSIVDSNLNGSFEIIKSGSTGGTHVIVEKQRDVNFKSNEGTPKWNIGSLGVDYNTTNPAVFYCIGGNNGTTDSNASGTISSTGSITVTTGGSGYQYNSPQIIVSGGGWRLQGGGNAQKDNVILRASTGVLLQRNSLSGNKAYIESSNPFD